MKRRVDLNADMGEAWRTEKVGSDDALVKLVSSASLACGFHGGDPLTIRKTVELCKINGVAVGAHPSFPDREGFGRAEMEVPVEELEAMVLYQVAAVRGISASCGVELQHVKPHGALYNMAAKRADYADAIIGAMSAISAELILIAQPGSLIEGKAMSSGISVAREGFPERGYLDDGRLAPRGTAGSIVTDPEEAAMRAVQMVTEGSVRAVSGKPLRMEIDTLCIHSDTPGAPSIARRVLQRLQAEGVDVAQLRSIMGDRRP